MRKDLLKAAVAAQLKVACGGAVDPWLAWHRGRRAGLYRHDDPSRRMFCSLQRCEPFPRPTTWWRRGGAESPRLAADARRTPARPDRLGQRPAPCQATGDASRSAHFPLCSWVGNGPGTLRRRRRSHASRALSNPHVIDLLNHCFVPVYLNTNEYTKDGPVSSEERAELQGTTREIFEAKLKFGTQWAVILAPDGEPLFGLHGCTAAKARNMIEYLEWYAAEYAACQGEALVAPRPQSQPPADRRPGAAPDGPLLCKSAVGNSSPLPSGRARTSRPAGEPIRPKAGSSSTGPPGPGCCRPASPDRA